MLTHGLNALTLCRRGGGGEGRANENFNEPPCKPPHELIDHLTITIPKHDDFSKQRR